MTYTVNGAAGTTTPEHLLLGEDGWYHATTLPAGRKGVPKVPQEQWTPQQFAGAFNGMSASRGTYNVQGTTFVRRHIGNAWLPVETTYEASGRTLIFRPFQFAVTTTYSDYRRRDKNVTD